MLFKVCRIFIIVCLKFKFVQIMAYLVLPEFKGNKFKTVARGDAGDGKRRCLAVLGISGFNDSPIYFLHLSRLIRTCIPHPLKICSHGPG